MPDLPSPDDLVMFWRQAGPDRWFNGGPEFDAEIARRFKPARQAAASGELDAWAETATGALALLLLLDQFPRNLFRGRAEAFATDEPARRVAEAALAAGFDQAVEPALRPFFYLPLEHSERLADQHRAVALFESLADADSLGWARKHRDAVARFGRFPDRNAALGRANTPAEQAYLDAGGLFGGGAGTA